LANRLSGVLASIIHPSQTGFIKDRQLVDNVMTVKEAMKVARRGDQNIAILLLDMEKAYDRVNWQFLVETLQQMGFGQTFTNTIITLLNGSQSFLYINGRRGETFNRSRSLQQGDPIFPIYLYSKWRCY
jgi:hypothetical protein